MTTSGTHDTDLIGKGFTFSFGAPSDSDPRVNEMVLTAFDAEAKAQGIELNLDLAQRIQGAYDRCSGYEGTPTTGDKDFLAKHIGFIRNVEMIVEGQARTIPSKSHNEFSFSQGDELFQSDELMSTLSGIVSGAIATDADAISEEVDTRFLRNLRAVKVAFAMVELGAVTAKVEELTEEVQSIKADRDQQLLDQKTSTEEKIQLLEGAQEGEKAEAEAAHKQQIEDAEKAHKAEVDALEAKKKAAEDSLNAAKDQIKTLSADAGTNGQAIADSVQEILRITEESSETASKLSQAEDDLKTETARLEQEKTDALAALEGKHNKETEAAATEAERKKQELLGQKDAELASVREELGQAQIDALAIKDSELLEKGKQIKALEGDKSGLESAAEKAKRANDELKDLLSDSKEETLAAKDIADGLRTANGEIQGKLTDATSRAETAEDDARTTADTLASKEEENASLKGRVTAAEDKVSSFATLGINSAADATKLISSGTEASGEASKSAEALTKALAKIEELNAQIRTLTEENTSLKAKVVQLTGERDDAIRRAESAEAELEKVSAAYKKCMGINHDLADQQMIAGYQAAGLKQISDKKDEVKRLNKVDLERLSDSKKATHKAKLEAAHKELRKLERIETGLRSDAPDGFLKAAETTIGKDAALANLPRESALLLEGLNALPAIAGSETARTAQIGNGATRPHRGGQKVG